MSMNKIVRGVFRRFGFEVYRSTVQTSIGVQLARIIARHEIDLVLDVGANAGHYAMELRAQGYGGQIVSFEPLAAAYAELAAAAAADSRWRIAPRMALGEAEGEIDIHVAGNSLSSSILDMLPAHEQAAPGSAFVGSEGVLLRRLDRVAPDYMTGAKSVLLKIDTQGYEDRVLKGASGVIDKMTAIQAELSLVPLYAGQPLFDEMRARIEALGFVLFAVFPGYVHERTGQTLQLDGVFLRRELAKSL